MTNKSETVSLSAPVSSVQICGRVAKFARICRSGLCGAERAWTSVVPFAACWLRHCSKRLEAASTHARRHTNRHTNRQTCRQTASGTTSLVARPMYALANDYEPSTVMSVSVCLSVCLSARDDISVTTHTIFTKLHVHATYGHSSVVFWRHNYRFCTAVFL